MHIFHILYCILVKMAVVGIIPYVVPNLDLLLLKWIIHLLLKKFLTQRAYVFSILQSYAFIGTNTP